MVKKGRLSKLEEHYIKTNPSMSNEELAEELDRSVDSVSKVVRVEEQPDDATRDVRSVDGTKIKHTSRGYVAMTGAEATRADSIQQRFTTRKVSDSIRPAKRED